MEKTPSRDPSSKGESGETEVRQGLTHGPLLCFPPATAYRVRALGGSDDPHHQAGALPIQRARETPASSFLWLSHGHAYAAVKAGTGREGKEGGGPPEPKDHHSQAPRNECQRGGGEVALTRQFHYNRSSNR